MIIPKGINKVSHSLIEKCLAASTNDRPSFSQIYEYIIKNEFKIIDGIESEVEFHRKFLGFTKDEFIITQ